MNEGYKKTCEPLNIRGLSKNPNFCFGLISYVFHCSHCLCVLWPQSSACSHIISTHCFSNIWIIPQPLSVDGIHLSCFFQLCFHKCLPSFTHVKYVFPSISYACLYFDTFFIELILWTKVVE